MLFFFWDLIDPHTYVLWILRSSPSHQKQGYLFVRNHHHPRCWHLHLQNDDIVVGGEDRHAILLEMMWCWCLVVSTGGSRGGGRWEGLCGSSVDCWWCGGSGASSGGSQLAGERTSEKWIRWRFAGLSFFVALVVVQRRKRSKVNPRLLGQSWDEKEQRLGGVLRIYPSIFVSCNETSLPVHHCPPLTIHPSVHPTYRATNFLPNIPFLRLVSRY